MTRWEVQVEAAGDTSAIAALTEAAFRDSPHGDGSEVAIVERLRAEGSLTLSLVVKDHSGAIVGHAAFSPVTVSDGAPGWFGLGPVSVFPSNQGMGVGSALIEHGLAGLKAMNARGCVVLGDPGYYGRFGFRHDTRLAFPGPPAEYFQALAFAGEVPEGTVRYAPAFG